jgi:hypothetical protein
MRHVNQCLILFIILHNIYYISKYTQINNTFKTKNTYAKHS